VTFAGNAHLRYALKATAQTWWNDSKSLVTARSDAFVVEKWQDEFDPRYLEPIEAVADTHIFMGGNGAVWLEAGVAEQLFIAGGMVMIRAGIKNNTKRHLSGIKVAIARRLIFPVAGMPGVPAQRPSLEPQITEVMHTQLFKGPSFEFPPNEEVVANLAVDLPRELRTIRKTRLFEVQVIALISAQMGNFAKDLTVEVPIYVAHSSSLQKPAAGSLEPLRGLPQRSKSAMSQHGQHENVPHHHHHHHNHQPHHAPHSPLTPYDPNMMSVEAYGAERGWSPAPFPNGGMGPPSRPSSAAPNLGASQMVVLPQSYQPFAFSPGQNGQEPQVMWDPNAQGWNASTLLQQGPPRPVSAQELARSQSAAPDLMRNNAPAALDVHHQRGPTAGSTHLLSNQNRRSSAPTQGSLPQQQQQQQQQQTRQQQPNSVLAASPQPQLIQMHQSIQPPQQANAHIQSGITTSQLLSLGAVPIAGLATIEEDSESAAGTVRSIRTLVGSVSRNDIAQFEAIAAQAQDDEQVKAAMMRVGMVPEDDKSLPKPPVPSTKEASTQSSRRPRASDLFVSTPDQVTELGKVQTAATPRKSLAKVVTQGPARPTSAQGQGLTALESRLGSQQNVGSKPVLTDETNKIPQRKTEGVATLGNIAADRRGSGALRAAAEKAAERERKAKEEEEEKSIQKRQQSQLAIAKVEEDSRKREREEKKQRRQEREREEAKERESRRLEERKRSAPAKDIELSAPALLNDVGLRSPTSDSGERKAVDVLEQKKLNKEAVGRVNGWLSSSPSNSRGLGEEDNTDPALSPKTPSPSVLKTSEPVEEALVIPSSSSSVLRGLASNSRNNDKDEITPTLSADLRALIDGSDIRPAPKQGTAIRSHIGSRRFSGDAVQEETKPNSNLPSVATRRLSSQSKQDIPSAASRGIPSSRSVGVRAGSKALEKTLTDPVTEMEEGEGKKYDARSARGGRGGRVASVANMWASIADGTDGSQIKSDDAPVLTLKPKALRSGVVGSSALDFSKAKSEENRKPSAKEIFANAVPLIVNDRIKSPPPKTKRAAHFVNTTIPKPVFANPTLSTSPIAQASAATRKYLLEKEEPVLPQGKLKESRKITSDLVAKEAKLKAGLDLNTDEDMACMPMNGRGTTKAIGREKLADLRSMWGG